MKIFKITSLFIIFLLANACKKEDTTPATTTPTVVTGLVKCNAATILDTLKGGKQLYLLTTFIINKVAYKTVLNIKDKKGKARVIFQGNLLEYDLEVVSNTETAAILRGTNTVYTDTGTSAVGIYFADTYTFYDYNCKIFSYVADISNFSSTQNALNYTDITNATTLTTTLKPYGW